LRLIEWNCRSLALPNFLVPGNSTALGMTKFKVVTQLSFEIGMERPAVLRSNVHSDHQVMTTEGSAVSLNEQQIPTLHIPVTNLEVMTILNFVNPSAAEGPAVPLNQPQIPALHIPVANLEVMTTLNFVIPSKARDLQFF
jgi:hypothetical protein